MNVHYANYEYTFNNSPQNPIKLDELTQLLPLLIDAWATLKTEEINLQVIPITSRLHTQISEFSNDGLKRHFKKQGKGQEPFGYFERGGEINYSSNPSKPQKFFDPESDITTDEIVQLLPLLIDAWKDLNTYEPINHKKIPPTSALHQKIVNSEKGLGRHFKPVPMSDNTEISFRYDSNYKYFFDPNTDDITAHDVAQILPILIEAWTNKTLPSLVRQKKIFSDLNDKIDNLPVKTKKNCFKEFSSPDS